MAAAASRSFRRVKSMQQNFCSLNPLIYNNTKRCLKQSNRTLSTSQRGSGSSTKFSYQYWCYGAGGIIIGSYIFNKFHRNSLKAAQDEKKDKSGAPMSRREARFYQFATYEYNGQIVMTPKDFIESLTENEPKLMCREKIQLRVSDVDNITQKTPSVSKGSNKFFRDCHQEGIITYSEYLFLVTILTKSRSGLKTALKMMDLNGDRIISSEEFKKIVAMINRSASKTTRSKEDGEAKEHVLHTTIMTHLFGRKSNELVTFEQFFKFMDDLQSEVLELEFHEYSKSMKVISELDFAKILLRNTILTEVEYCNYLDRLKRRLEDIEHLKGISLDQFKAFHTFLNNIDDFAIAINMTNLMSQPVDKELFARSIAITTGKDLEPHVLDVVFNLFDEDGDGKLSQQEFIGIMKDRLKRGFGKFPNTRGFAGFKHCLKKEMSK